MMKKFLTLSLSLICIVGNNVYTMSENNNNINFKPDSDIYNNELNEFEKWSYEKLEALYNNEVYCSTWYGNFTTNEQFLKKIRKKLKTLLIDYGEEVLIDLQREELWNNLEKDYKEYIRKYCNWEFYTGYGMARYFGLTRIPYMQSVFYNDKYKSAIDKILHNNIDKFVFNYFRL